MSNPDPFEGCYLTLADSPTYWLIRNGQRIEIETPAQMHAYGLRTVLTVSPTQLEAYPIPGKAINIQLLNSTHMGETLYVIGKGVSLRQLEKKHLGPGPVVAINSAIEVVEALKLKQTVYSLQKDHCYTKPRKAALLVHKHESRFCFDGYEPQYVFDNPVDFDAPINLPSVATAVFLAKLFGCAEVVYLCCDACTTGETGRWQDNEIQHPHNETNYLLHCEIVREQAARIGMPVSWLDILEGA